MNNVRSMFATLAERARDLVSELSAPFQLRREQLLRAAYERQQLAAELDRWRAWSTRLVLAERWARCAAEHDRASHWRVLLSAEAVAALLADNLGELEVGLAERAKAAEQFATDPETGEKIASPAQQVGLVHRAMLEELIAAKTGTTRHYYDPVRLHNGDALQASLQTWDRQKLDLGSRDLVTSATNNAITIATERLGPAARVTTSL
jgi:ClpP class serine protease